MNTLTGTDPSAAPSGADSPKQELLSPQSGYSEPLKHSLNGEAVTPTIRWRGHRSLAGTKAGPPHDLYLLSTFNIRKRRGGKEERADDVGG